MKDLSETSTDSSYRRNDKNEGTILFRPLLSLTKSEILEYAKEHSITYREDSSNSDTTYQRNKLRHDILPKFTEINPEYRRAIENFIEYTEGLKNWIDEEVRKFLGEEKSFSVVDFERHSSFFQREIIRYLYETTHSGTI